MSEREDAEFAALPERMQRYIRQAEMNERQAREVFDHFNTPPTLVWKGLNKIAALFDPGIAIHKEKLGSLISKNLNSSTLPIFVELILKNQQSARQAANAIKRHAENHAMKADVFLWLETNMASFKSMDSAAQAITRQQPIAFRTARDWVGEWKKLRSTSTP